MWKLFALNYFKVNECKFVCKWNWKSKSVCLCQRKIWNGLKSFCLSLSLTVKHFKEYYSPELKGHLIGRAPSDQIIGKTVPFVFWMGIKFLSFKRICLIRKCQNEDFPSCYHHYLPTWCIHSVVSSKTGARTKLQFNLKILRRVLWESPYNCFRDIRIVQRLDIGQ